MGYVSEISGVVRPTALGLEFVARTDAVVQSAPVPASAYGKLSPAQEEFLRELLRQTGPVLEERADGRVLRALQARGLVTLTAGWVRPTDTAAVQLASHARRDQMVRTRRASRSAQSARAEAVLRAVEQLEAVMPRGAELLLGGHPAYVDDVLTGLRRFARAMSEVER